MDSNSVFNTQTWHTVHILISFLEGQHFKIHNCKIANISYSSYPWTQIVTYWVKKALLRKHVVKSLCQTGLFWTTKRKQFASPIQMFQRWGHHAALYVHQLMNASAPPPIDSERLSLWQGTHRQLTGDRLLLSIGGSAERRQTRWTASVICLSYTEIT